MVKRNNHPNLELCGAVLLADDHEVLRVGLSGTLQRRLKATKVIEASCFKEAIEALKAPDADEIQLAIFDLTMPDSSDLTQQLLEIRRIRPSVKVVVYTGSDERSYILSALSAGIHGYILKKDNIDKLIERLQYVLSGEIYVPPLLSELPLELPVEANKNHSEPPVNTPESVQPKLDRFQLSTRQFEVLRHLVDGLSNKEIARDMALAESTVKMHVGGVFRAFGVNNRAKAAVIGRRLIDGTPPQEDDAAQPQS